MKRIAALMHEPFGDVCGCAIACGSFSARGSYVICKNFK